MLKHVNPLKIIELVGNALMEKDTTRETAKKLESMDYPHLRDLLPYRDYDGEIMQHKRMALLTLIQKHIRRRDMTELVNEIVKLLSYNYYTDNQVITLFNYLIQEGNAQKPMEFITEIAKQSEKHEGALMTIAQALKQEGYQLGKNDGVQEGIQKGIQIGEQTGEKQASMKIARQMLESGIDRQSVMKLTGLTDTEMSNLFKD